MFFDLGNSSWQFQLKVHSVAVWEFLIGSRWSSQPMEFAKLWSVCKCWFPWSNRLNMDASLFCQHLRAVHKVIRFNDMLGKLYLQKSRSVTTENGACREFCRSIIWHLQYFYPVRSMTISWNLGNFSFRFITLDSHKRFWNRLCSPEPRWFSFLLWFSFGFSYATALYTHPWFTLRVFVLMSGFLTGWGL